MSQGTGAGGGAAHPEEDVGAGEHEAVPQGEQAARGQRVGEEAAEPLRTGEVHGQPEGLEVRAESGLRGAEQAHEELLLHLRPRH